MTAPMHHQDAIHEAQFAVTQAEELLELARGRLARAKKAYLDDFLQQPKPPVAAGFTADPILTGQPGVVQLDKTLPAATLTGVPNILRCRPCATQTPGAHHITDTQCIFYGKEAK